MNSDYDNNTETSSDFHLSPPSPDAQDIFRRNNTTAFDSSDFSTTTNYNRPSSSTIKYPQQQQQNPRKKRTRMLRLDDTHPNLSKSKKPDPSAPKITRPCSECGKKFWSWKALFGHMRCHPERQWRGINPPPNFKKPDSGGGAAAATGSDTSYGDDFGTRMTDEDHHVATCLLMLANGPISACDQTPAAVIAAAAITTAAANNVGLSDSDTVFRDVGGVSGYGDYDGSGGSNGRFECSSCKKVFGSHQALGGHRASHKNVKGCFAITKTEGEEDVAVQEFVKADDHERNNIIGDQGRILGDANNHMVTLLGSGTSTVLMPLSAHQCGICLRVFSSGQALGGHKRCHWEKIGDESGNIVGASSSITQGLNVGSFGMTACGLDLNMPAPVDDASSSVSYSSNLALDLRLGL